MASQNRIFIRRNKGLTSRDRVFIINNKEEPKEGDVRILTNFGIEFVTIIKQGFFYGQWSDIKYNGLSDFSIENEYFEMIIGEYGVLKCID